MEAFPARMDLISVPVKTIPAIYESIKSNENLMKMIKYIEEADNKEGGSGAFNIYLKKSKE